jgi:hypothetical protein
MNSLHEVLEICLEEIEQGADIDTVLFRYPEFADELRPILETSLGARNMAVPTPSAEVVRRNRAKVLQQAARLREAKVKASSRRRWRVSLRRAAVMLFVVAALFVGGTNLVRAASTTVPGDNLYPVKRTWEDVLLLFTFNLQQREALEVEHENERLHELRELFAEGRSEEVEFAGLVTSQNGNVWVVSGIPVMISTGTEIRDQGIGIGSAVRVKGQTQGDVAVIAERIDLLPPGANLPDLEEDEEHENENQEGEAPKKQDSSGQGLEEGKLSAGEPQKLNTESGPKDEYSNSGSENSGSEADSSSADEHSTSDSGSQDHSNSEEGEH